MGIIENIQYTSLLVLAFVLVIAWLDREAWGDWLGDNCHKTITVLVFLAVASPIVFFVSTLIRIWG